VSEAGGSGLDLVKSSVSFTLGAGLEQLVLTGTGAINGTGNSLDNLITGNGLANILAGGGGNDQLNGGAGNDTLNGGEGHDILNGGTGRDTMAGGLGDDSYQVERGDDVTTEAAGEGIDTVLASVSHVLKANIEHLVLTGSGDASGTGNSLDNLIEGNSGDNYLKGMEGDDLLDGGAGRDTLAGGLGANIYRFDAMLDFAGLDAAGCDIITQFDQADGDRIDLSGLDANSLLEGDQGFSFLGNGAFTGSAGELRYYQASSNTYVQGDLNGDGVGDFLIQLNGSETLQASDFLI
jgi:Ca2+-binding RTX toxin-like protein